MFSAILRLYTVGMGGGDGGNCGAGYLVRLGFQWPEPIHDKTGREQLETGHPIVQLLGAPGSRRCAPKSCH